MKNAAFLKNPFERIAGWPALGLGLAAMALTAWLGKVNGLWFDGVLDVHIGAREQSWTEAFSMQGVAWLSMVLCVGLAGLIFGKSRFRLIDVAGTLAFSRLPMLLLALLAFLPIVPAGLKDIPRVVIFVLLCIGATVWMVIWMYRGYSVSCRVSGDRGIASFAGALLVGETISKLVLIFLLLGAGSSSARAAAPAAEITQSEISLQQTAAQVMKAFEQEDFAAVVARFDETMQKAMPELQLSQVWMQLQLQCGPYVKANTDVEATERQGYSILLVPCEFKNKTVNFQFAFNSSGQISGLYFK